jgi:peptidoglycan/xylan/chitin deacetylase (PgdA/CDA1 family)
MNTTDKDHNSNSANNKRKRINRMKTIIVIIVILLMILPTICCIILGLQVSRLQKQVDDLVSIHSQYGLIDDNSNSNNYVYAAEKSTTNDASINDEAIHDETVNDATINEEAINDEAINDKTINEQSINDEGINDKTINDEAINNEAINNEIINNEPIYNKVLSNGIINNEIQNKEDFLNKTSIFNASSTEISDENLAEEHQTSDSDKTALYENENAAITKDDNGESASELGNKDESGEQKSNKKANKSKVKNEDEINNLSNGIYSGKKVYLTFDDGPSMYTDDILDILAEHNVKATFFVIGNTDKRSKDLYKRIVEEGHTLGMHSYSHIYKKIYNSLEDFDKDFTKLWKLLYDTTGYKPSIFRFPGGSDNLVNKNGMEDFIRYLNKASITYYDWNVLNGDATGIEYTKEQLINNVLEGVAIKETPIVLMHDAQTKKTTVDSLPGLLDALISGGAEILPIDEDTPPTQMIKADSLK